MLLDGSHLNKGKICKYFIHEEADEIRVLAEYLQELVPAMTQQTRTVKLDGELRQRPCGSFT